MPFALATTAALLALLLSGCDGHDLTESGDTKGADTEREPYTWAPCTDPEPVLDPKGSSTGWVRCADGSVNRVEAVPVDMALYDVRECGVVKPGGCYSDANCTERPNGRCAEWTSFGGPWCACTYLCSADADCATGECGYNPCGVYPRDPDGVACRTGGDACRVDDDCDWGWAGNWCSPSDGSWSCRLCIDPS